MMINCGKDQCDDKQFGGVKKITDKRLLQEETERLEEWQHTEATQLNFSVVCMIAHHNAPIGQ